MEKPIRILMVVSQMNRAGIESRLMEWYRGIDRTKIQFDFYTFSQEEGQFDEEIRSLGGTVYYNRGLSVRRLKQITQEMAVFCKAHPEYCIVHAHMNQWSGAILKGAYIAGVPLRIAHSRTSLVKVTTKNIVKNLIKGSVNRYANYKLAVSDKAGAWLFGKRAVSRGEVQFWKNAIPCEKFVFSPDIRNEKRNELGIGDALTLIHVGNLRFEKNHPYLFRIFAEILKSKPESQLVLVGRDHTDGGLEQLAKELGIHANTHFLGSRSDVPQLLQAGDVFVFPSFYEGFPGAVLEAQAAGLHCVVSDTITKEILVTELVEMRSIEEAPKLWAERILNLDLTVRPNTVDVITKAGFSLADTVERVQKFYLAEAKRIEDETR